MSQPSHPVFARLYDPVMCPVERTVLESHRRYLIEDLTGRVLDLGAGTGGMFPYFEERTTERGNFAPTAIEPDPHMRHRAIERARDLELEIDVKNAIAESLPFVEDSFDAVVASLVFCTIPDVDAALSEIARVLKPGGELRFLEHVRGSGVKGVAFDLAAPAWKVVAGGCHLNRETGRRFRRDERFDVIDSTRVTVGGRELVPIVRGTLERRFDELDSERRKDGPPRPKS